MASNGDGRGHGVAESSQTSSITSPCPCCGCPKKETSSISSRFKGVVPQQNGNWGAQIYANHQRIWLGTFKSESDAAMAYDSAAMKLRSGDCHRNFPWTEVTVEEPNFQHQYTTEAILSMIKDGSYQSKLAEYMRARSQGAEDEAGITPKNVGNREGMLCKLLFQKELTPSDVGKLNRLVVPKKHAMKFFPRISESAEENGEGSGAGDAVLVFHDRMMREWKFRYCYWKSSHSYVFTKGWNRFVKEKQLEASDIINFYLCKWKDGEKASETFCMIDFEKVENVGNAEANDQASGMQVELNVELDIDDYKVASDDGEPENLKVRKAAGKLRADCIDEEPEDSKVSKAAGKLRTDCKDEEPEDWKSKAVSNPQTDCVDEEKGIKLFGVRII